MKEVFSGLCLIFGIIVAAAGLVVLLSEVVPRVNTIRPQLRITHENGYTCVKQIGDRSSTCTKDAK